MGIGSLIGGLAGAGASLFGANQISNAANQGVQWNQQVYNQELGQLSPWITTGQNALYSLASLLGVPGATMAGQGAAQPGASGALPAGTTTATGVPPGGVFAAPYTVGSGRTGGSGSTYLPGALTPLTATQPAATPATPPSSYGSPTSAFKAFQQTPYYQFPLQQGLQSLGASNAARGLYNSGATAKDILQYATGYASQGLGGYMSALSNLAGGGQSAIQSAASTGVGVSGNVLSGMLTGAGAQAAGLGSATQNLVGNQGALTPFLNGLTSSSYGTNSGLSANSLTSGTPITPNFLTGS
jgi:hypothetical protein